MTLTTLTTIYYSDNKRTEIKNNTDIGINTESDNNDNKIDRDNNNDKTDSVIWIQEEPDLFSSCECCVNRVPISAISLN